MRELLQGPEKATLPMPHRDRPGTGHLREAAPRMGPESREKAARLRDL